MTEAVPATARAARSPAHDDPEAILPWPAQRVQRSFWRGLLVTGGERDLAEEIPVAFTYNGSTHAVMMASPCDLEDFAFGFSLTEGIISDPAEIESLDVIPASEGVELRMWIARSREEYLCQRRRRLAGPTGCGLCGIESLADALRPIGNVQNDLAVPASFISAQLAEITTRQHLNRQTHAVHAAAWCRPEHEMVLREDIGRHNALDKLGGALVRKHAEARQGLLVLSSRVSIEMVQKSAAIGIPIIVAISAPTALAVRACDHAGVTLIAVARQDGFEVFTHPRRIRGS
jgi:FdhD protein